jgi:hypothetical protein
LICIFCLQERRATVEHVFPDAIGGLLKIDRVCKTCGDRLGKNADAPLVEHPAIVGRGQVFQPNPRASSQRDQEPRHSGYGFLAGFYGRNSGFGSSKILQRDA